MKLTFSLNPQGVAFVKEQKGYLYPNISYDEPAASITLDTEGLSFKSTVGQFMSEVQRRGLLIGRKGGELVMLDANCITKYPCEAEVF